MSGILFILITPIVFFIIVLNLTGSSKRDHKSNDGGYYGTGGSEFSNTSDSGSDGGDGGGGGGE
ncbi:hypothetical protein LS684_22055 (plasmid) [Cytobacillus spongiae]|uniref:hypothetical protein n=1 Tax=Cytobacillus spongiae TaxID=2901381 RepID=UPI001F4166A1|nr:hypothetical protein [Cytobacillus spongiae]UII58295.1 hypothetical protein LS684_22055 [Cytobacillus spongiae]